MWESLFNTNTAFQTLIIYEDKYITVFNDNSFKLKDKTMRKMIWVYRDKKVIDTVFFTDQYNIYRFNKCDLLLFNENKKIIARYKGIKTFSNKVYIYIPGKTNVFKTTGMCHYYSRSKLNKEISTIEDVNLLYDMIFFNSNLLNMNTLINIISKQYMKLIIKDVAFNRYKYHNKYNIDISVMREYFNNAEDIFIMAIIAIMSRKEFNKTYYNKIKEYFYASLKWDSSSARGTKLADLKKSKLCSYGIKANYFIDEYKDKKIELPEYFLKNMDMESIISFINHMKFCSSKLLYSVSINSKEFRYIINYISNNNIPFRYTDTGLCKFVNYYSTSCLTFLAKKILSHKLKLEGDKNGLLVMLDERCDIPQLHKILKLKRMLNYDNFNK